MIRINLLPVKRKRKTQPLPPVVIQAILLLVVTALVLVFLGFHFSGKIEAMKNEKATKEMKLASLKEQLKEVENFEKLNKLFQKRKKIIEDLKKKQHAPLLLLDQVSAHLPEGIWLTNLTDKGGVVEISGYAFSNTELVSYVQSLKGSKHLTDVSLKESRQQKIGDALIYQFKMTLRVKV
jgi:type IV pilus assembly protein PilN